MTRITNFGRKRKYLEAGFAADQTTPSNEPSQAVSEENTTSASQLDSVHANKKRKRTKKPSADDEQAAGDIEAAGGEKGVKSFTPRQKPFKATKKPDGTKSVAISGYKRRTEQRRLQRIADRQADTICFACREKGHAAKDCPAATGEDQKNGVSTTVVICYRCGSVKHTLSRCKMPEDLLNRLPFASCFVCSEKGHLASSCPQNKEKGIYPNGGCCKLCRENTHLAKDCELRKKDASGTAATSTFGTGKEAGADEDDFHTFKRKNAEVSKDEKVDRRSKRLDVNAGLREETVKVTQVSTGRPKKVVFF